MPDREIKSVEVSDWNGPAIWVERGQLLLGKDFKEKEPIYTLIPLFEKIPLRAVYPIEVGDTLVDEAKTVWEVVKVGEDEALLQKMG